MPRPHRITSSELELIRKIDTLQIKLLQTNSQLRIKTLYAEKLEMLLRHRQETIDELHGKLELAWQQNQKLDIENTCLTTLIAASLDNDRTLTDGPRQLRG